MKSFEQHGHSLKLQVRARVCWRVSLAGGVGLAGNTVAVEACSARLRLALHASYILLKASQYMQRHSQLHAQNFCTEAVTQPTPSLSIKYHPTVFNYRLSPSAMAMFLVTHHDKIHSRVSCLCVIK
eukprot:2878323-Amphidinium_carterae.1